MTRIERVSLIALGGWFAWMLVLWLAVFTAKNMGFDVREAGVTAIVYSMLAGGLLVVGVLIAYTAALISLYWRQLRLGR